MLQHVNSVFFYSGQTYIWGRCGPCGRCSVLYRHTHQQSSSGDVIIRPITILRPLSTYFHIAERRLYLLYSGYTYILGGADGAAGAAVFCNTPFC